MLAFVTHLDMDQEDSKLSQVWNHAVSAYLLIATTYATCAWLIWHTPPPSVAATLLTVVAAVMSIRDNSSAHKFLWLIAMAILLRVEFKAIKIDREANTKEQQQRFAEQQKEFEAIAGQINMSITQNGLQFSKAAEAASKTLRSADSSTMYAQHAVGTLTGKDSYPFVAAQVSVDGPKIPLVLWANGPNVLTNVAVTVHRSSAFKTSDDYSFLMKPSSLVGAVHSGWPRVLTEAIEPHLDPGKT